MKVCSGPLYERTHYAISGLSILLNAFLSALLIGKLVKAELVLLFRKVTFRIFARRKSRWT